MSILLAHLALLAFPATSGEEEAIALERRLASGVSEERAAKRVRELVAMGPRMGGTDSGARAVHWRKRTFAALGLSVESVAGPQTWCHEELGWKITAHVAGSPPRVLDRAWPYGFSPSTRGRLPLGSGRGPCVGLAAQRGRHVRAQESLVLIDGRNTPDGEYPVIHHLTPGPRNQPAFGISEAEGAFLRAALAAEKEVDIEFELDAHIRQARPHTVVGTLRAAEGAPPGFVLFCAHGDSDAGGPGANDNASGEAIVFEIAEAWTAAIADGTLPRPAREIRFAIWGSEILSTRHYWKELDGAPLLGVVNFDQSGFGSSDDVLYLEPDDLPGNLALARRMLSVLEEHSGHAGFPKRWATVPSQGGTDSYVFSGDPEFRRHERPALTVFASAWGRANELARTEGMPGDSWNDGDTVHVDYDAHYHSAGDVPANTTDREPWNMAWAARVSWLGVLRWLAANETH